jgi:Family of unknown function (DUF6178)
MKTDLLTQIIFEADAYRKLEDIEKLVEQGMNLSMVPIQPLYVAIHATSTDQVAQLLPRLSSDQRQALRDIDIWHKDEIEPKSGQFWLEVFSKCSVEEIIQEFVSSEDFLLIVKNQLTIYTFDVEDPIYPDHDNYFLTEDNLLLIEYHDDFLYASELKKFIQLLYSNLGVENAYAHLFKMVSDSYLIMEEQNYNLKTERLRDYGFVDYYEAIEFNAILQNSKAIDAFINTKVSLTPNIEVDSINQNLHPSALVVYHQGLEDIKASLALIDDEKRISYLHFNFIRLNQARLSLADAVKKGSVSVSLVGSYTKQCLELGHDYILKNISQSNGVKIFNQFDFFDLFKIGHSLLELAKKSLKKHLSSTPFEKDDFSYFLGCYWNSFIENSLTECPKFKFDGSSKASDINSMSVFIPWEKSIQTLNKAIPFILTFFSTIQKLKSEGVLNDQFYLNYELDQIDVEAILISSFINFTAGHFDESQNPKMGVSLIELKKFYGSYFNKKGEEYLIHGLDDLELQNKIEAFLIKFGLSQIPDFHTYLFQILVEQLNGYEIDNMLEEEFKHMGGPILLNTLKN